MRLRATRLACNWLQAQMLEAFEILQTCTLICNNSICHDGSMQLLHRGLACLLCQEVGKCHHIWVQRECVHCGYTALPQRSHLPTHPRQVREQEQVEAAFIMMTSRTHLNQLQAFRAQHTILSGCGLCCFANQSPCGTMPCRAGSNH